MAPLLALALAALADAPLVRSEEPPRTLLPVQGDVAAVGMLGPGSAPALALYAGYTWGLAKPPWGVPYLSFGAEFVYGLGDTPYRTSLGLQLRGGYAWTSLGKDDELQEDLFLYARASLFFATIDGWGGDRTVPRSAELPGTRTSFAGARVGVGLTSPFWSRVFLRHGLLKDHTGFWPETAKVLATIVLLPVALLNHAELVLEAADTGHTWVSLTVRVGAGF